MEEDLKKLNDDIKDYKLNIFNETLLILFYTLNTYRSSLMNFGTKSSVSKDCLSILHEFNKINSYEKRILKFIKNNIATIDTSVALELIDQMSERKEEEILYYYKILDDMEDACEMKDEARAKRIKKEYPSIFEDEEFMNNLYASKYTIIDIMNFFHFTQEMIDFIKPRIFESVYEFAQDRDVFGVNYKTNNENIVTDIRLILPTIMDYETLMINVNLLMKACYFFIAYRYKVPINLEEYEIKANLEEKRYKEEFAKQLLPY